jgi:tetratricopeptide (TPR) repeat protein
LGREHPNTLIALNNLAAMLQDQGKLSEAEPLFREALRIRRAVLSDGHPQIADSLAGLGIVLLEQGQVEEAEPLLGEALEIRRRSLPKVDWHTPATESLVGGCWTVLGRYADAEPLVLGSYQMLATAPGAPAKVLQQARDRIVKLYETWGMLDKAAAWRAMRDQQTPPVEKSKGE